MVRNQNAVDISGMPELLRIAEAVQLSQQPRVLRRSSEDIAVVVPVPATWKRSRRTTVNHAAVLGTAGSWRDLVDAEALKEQLAAERGSDLRQP